MLKRLYINNFRGLVNFDLSMEAVNLFLGPNGSGKSTVFDVLRKIQTLITQTVQTDKLFNQNDLTRWQKSQVQQFELEVEGNQGRYRYELAIEYPKNSGLFQSRARIYYERLWYNNDLLFKFDEPSADNSLAAKETAQLFFDDQSGSQAFPLNRNLSGIALLPPRRGTSRLIWFKDYLTRLIVIQVRPIDLTMSSETEETQLSHRLENFVEWYRYISQDQGVTLEITAVIKQVLDGFEYFKLSKDGSHHIMEAAFSSEKNRPTLYRFEELSDGQQMLIVLYTLIYQAHRAFTHSNELKYTLCIDEPENFLALAEIQPWLTTLYDFCIEDSLQALLISHHPELINYLATSSGFWFENQPNSPVRVRRIADEQANALPISELVARGWLNG
jgi:predicted ATPase